MGFVEHAWEAPRPQHAAKPLSCPSPVAGAWGPALQCAADRVRTVRSGTAFKGRVRALPEVKGPVTVGPRQSTPRGGPRPGPQRVGGFTSAGSHGAAPWEKECVTPSEGRRRPAGRGGRVARRRVGGDFKGPDVLRTSHEQRRAHPRPCTSAGEMPAPRRPRPPGSLGPEPVPFPSDRHFGGE